LFDTRALDHSTILYETGDAQPLLRLAWNPLDNNYVACFGVDSQQVVIVDVRSAAVPVAILNGHSSASSMNWAPHNSGWIAVSDLQGVKLWDVSQNVVQPTWHLPTSKAVQKIVWPSSAPDWMALSTNSVIQIVKL
jgi:WD repeat-containing protein 68